MPWTDGLALRLSVQGLLREAYAVLNGLRIATERFYAFQRKSSRLQPGASLWYVQASHYIALHPKPGLTILQAAHALQASML